MQMNSETLPALSPASHSTASYLLALAEETSDGFKFSRCWAAGFPKQV